LNPIELSEDDLQTYQRDGVVCLRNAFDASWISLLAEAVEQNMAEPGPHVKVYTAENEPGLFFGDYCNWQRIPGYRRFAFESPAASIAARCMGSRKVHFFHEHVLVKEPGTPNPTPWHHDQPYWVVDGDQVCSLWLPLDPVQANNAVSFVAGSHRWGKWFTPTRFVDGKNHAGSVGEQVPDIDANPDCYDLRSFAMEPGDCLVFHALTLHGAPGNISLEQRRRAVATRWTGDDARFARRDGYMSPPFEEVTLSSGDAMDCETFPLVWQAEQYSRP